MELTDSYIDGLYQQAFEYILQSGSVEGSRAGQTKECLGLHFCLTNPRQRVLSNPVRKISLRFMLAEFLWIMSGRNDVEMISFYNKRMKDFSDDGIVLHGAYGKRLRQWQGFDQVDGIIKTLRKFPNSRQAVMVIFDPKQDTAGNTKDVPCNNLLQFILRDGKLNAFAYVRSQDMFLGFPYDVFHWTLLQELIANSLKVEVGSYFHSTGSCHIYADNWQIGEKISKVKNIPIVQVPRVDIDYGGLGCLFDIEERFRRGTPAFDFHHLTPFEQWVVSKIC